MNALTESTINSESGRKTHNKIIKRSTEEERAMRGVPTTVKRQTHVCTPRGRGVGEGEECGRGREGGECKHRVTDT